MDKCVIIIGAAKSGTSTLMDYISEHEDVNTSAGKEPRYFCDGYYEEYNKKGVKYEDLWDKKEGRIYLEASTGYSKYPAVTGGAENMEKYGIEPKIIYIVRSPIERMVSHAKYMMWRDRSIEMDHLREACVCSSEYYTQAKRYLDVFGKNEFKLIMLPDMSRRPNRVLENVFRFIDEKKSTKVENKKKNETRNVTEMELAIRESPVWKLKGIIPNWAKNKIRDIWGAFSEGPEKRVIRGIDEERIRDMCRDALRLEEIFSVDLDDWRRDIARSEILA